MVNPSYLQNFEIQQRGLDFHLYIRPDILVSADANQEAAVSPPSEPIYDGLGPKGKLVAQALGLQKGASTAVTNCFNIFSILFTDERFKGSSFKVLRTSQAAEAGDDELAIIGGTGQFACARGVAALKTIQQLKHGEIKELRIRALCLLTFPPKILNQPMRIGPWGGKEGTIFDIEEKPRRLESVTISWGEWIDSLAFSYEDKAGERQSVGPWGGSGANTATFMLDSTEIVTEVSGTTTVSPAGHTFVQSLKFVTSKGIRKTYGSTGGTRFNFPLQDNNSVVGFFVRAEDYVNAVGIYVNLALTI